jgi:hypothetical protein
MTRLSSAEEEDDDEEADEEEDNDDGPLRDERGRSSNSTDSSISTTDKCISLSLEQAKLLRYEETEDSLEV